MLKAICWVKCFPIATLSTMDVSSTSASLWHNQHWVVAQALLNWVVNKQFNSIDLLFLHSRLTEFRVNSSHALNGMNLWQFSRYQIFASVIKMSKYVKQWSHKCCGVVSYCMKEKKIQRLSLSFLPVVSPSRSCLMIVMRHDSFLFIANINNRVIAMTPKQLDIRGRLRFWKMSASAISIFYASTENDVMWKTFIMCTILGIHIIWNEASHSSLAVENVITSETCPSRKSKRLGISTFSSLFNL